MPITDFIFYLFIKRKPWRRRRNARFSDSTVKRIEPFGTFSGEYSYAMIIRRYWKWDMVQL